MNAFNLIGKNIAIIGDYGTEYFYNTAKEVSFWLKQHEWIVYNQYDWAISCRNKDSCYTMCKAIVDTCNTILVFKISQNDPLTISLINYALYLGKEVLICNYDSFNSIKDWADAFNKEMNK